MRLIGRRIEDKFRNELAQSRRVLMNDDKHARLRYALQARGADVARCIVLNWIPEQGEDIYEVLHGSDVLIVEIPHDRPEVAIQIEALTDYMRRRCGRPQRIKIAVALDLLQKGFSDAANNS